MSFSRILKISNKGETGGVQIYHQGSGEKGLGERRRYLYKKREKRSKIEKISGIKGFRTKKILQILFR